MPSNNLSPDSYNRQSEEGLRHIKQVLHNLRVHLFCAVAEWRRFSGPDGDTSFFSDITDRNAKRALHRIGEYFSRIEFHMQKLELLDKLTEEAAKCLTHRLEVETNQFNRQILSLNHENCRLSRRTTWIALQNQRAAEETSRTTRANVQVSD
jgi:hypothetical protein